MSKAGSEFLFLRLRKGAYLVRCGGQDLGTVVRVLGGWASYPPGYTMARDCDATREDAAQMLLYRKNQD